MIKQFFSPLVSFKSTKFLSISSCVGLSIGILPLYGIRGILASLLLLVFRFNIIAFLLGLTISYLMPVVFTGISSFSNSIAVSEAMSGVLKLFFNNGFFSLKYYSRNEICLFISLSSVMAFASTGIFYILYNVLYSRVLKKDIPFYRYAIASAVGFFFGLLPLSKYSLIAFFVAFVLLRINIFAMASGFLAALCAASPILNYSLYLAGRSGDNYALSRIITGKLSIAEYISLPQDQKSIMLLLVSLLVFIIISSYGGWSILYKYAYNSTAAGKKYVFHDVSGTRWILIKRIVTAVLITLLLIVTVFGFNINAYANTTDEVYDPMEDTEDNATTLKLPDINPNVYAFYVSWDKKSKNSFINNVDKIDVLIPDWLHLKNNLSIDIKNDSQIDALAAKNNVDVYPLINNYIEDKWNPQIVEGILNNPKKQQDFIDNITGVLSKNGYQGLNLDFEYIKPEYKQKYVVFVKALKLALSKKNLKLVLDLQANNPSYDYKSLSNVADKAILMVYDEHESSSKPGPVSSQTWFEKTIKSSGIQGSKLVAGIGLYGYDWEQTPDKNGIGLTFNEIMKLASDNKASFLWDPIKKAPFLKYQISDVDHLLYFNDAAVFYNQVKYCLESDIADVGIWRLGSEDASIWDLLKMIQEKNINTSGFIKPRLVDDPVINRNKEVLLGYIPETPGVRVFKTNSKGSIEKENYLGYPKNPLITGSEIPDKKVVALTFDDGPDPLYTPQILDILAKYQVKATFFVLGSNSNAYPKLISRIYNDGHAIGNHTYNHINMENESFETIKRELLNTNKTIESATGHSTILFRPPYDWGIGIENTNALNTFIKINNTGFTMVGNSIDSNDWDAGDENEIYENVYGKLDSGNIILMHDSGGNRSLTLKALPKVIESLKSDGYEFALVGDLLGKTKSQTMPSSNLIQLSFVKVSELVSSSSKVVSEVITKFFYISTMIGLLRFVFLLFFSTKQRRDYMRKRFDNASSFKPKVSIVVAAYNEEKVICKTVNSLLQSDYENFEIIVVNDGSKDNTSAVVEENYNGNPKVRLINKENGGKSSAVNKGFVVANGEIVVVLDADTIISKDAISLLIRHFTDPNVAAVSGNVKVGNTNNLWTKWQHVEYVTGLNLERRAFDALNCITVVPGAIGAWRKELVAKAGYYKEDTLAEDADITLTFLRQGYKIVYEEGAKAFTEAPEDLKSLLKQRVRWSYGTLQCLWKHRDALFSTSQKTLGFIALPNTWLYQVVFQSLSPLTDILFFLGIFGSHRLETLITYIAFFIIDFFITCYAFHLEKESWKPLKWLFIQRIVYRQLMTYVVYKSIISALRGVKVGWNKLVRLGNVPQ